MGAKKNSLAWLLLLVFLTGLTPSVWSQKESEKLRKKQKELQRKIETTKNLIGKNRNEERITIAELAIINQQIAYRDELITNYGQQVGKIESEISKNKNDIIRLQTELKKLKKKYTDLVRYAYKHRNSYHRLVYIFASESFNQAYVRVKYLQQFGEHRKKQAQLIRAKQKEITGKIEALKSDKQKKEEIIHEQKSEKQNHLTDKNKQQESLAKLKNEEKKLREELNEQEKQKERLAHEIKKAIEEEIRKEREKERARNDAKKKNNTGGNKTTPKNNTDNKSNDKRHYDVNTPDIEPESVEFEKNRGRLPWPVEKGEIVSYFGRNPHPTLSGVEVNNNGIDIGTGKGASVRAVFNGKVSSVIVIPNAGKCVIISHGAYRTVYANLASVSVSKGQEIKTKQAIGTLLPAETGNLSEAHFEIWKVTTEDMEKQNPALWLYK